MQASELLQSYLVDANTWDEMYTNASVREQYKKAVEFMQQLSVDELNKKEELAKIIPMQKAISYCCAFLSFSNSITSTNQILAQSLGVAVSAILLRVFSALQHEPLLLTPTVFHYVFLTLGILTCFSTYVFSRLERYDGRQMLEAKEST